MENIPAETKDSDSGVILQLNHGQQQFFSLKQIHATFITLKTQEKQQVTN